MRFQLAVLSASAVSAAILPPIQARDGAVNLPASAFPTFKTVPLEDAKAGKDRKIQGLPDPATSDDLQIDADAATVVAATCPSNSVHIEWKSYPDADRLKFVQAVKCLMTKPASGNFPPATNRYEDLVRLHQQFMPQVHNSAFFLIWHRYYLWTFEQVLRTECGFTSAMPWWDETLDAGHFAASDMFTNPSYFGALNPPDSSGNPTCVTNGQFAGITAHIGPGPNSTPHCLSRGVSESLTAQCNSAYLATCAARTDYSDYESCLEYGPHAYGHNGVGGVMSDVYASPSDPLFWMHHSFVDHAWWSWQQANAVWVSSVDGVDTSGTALTLNTVINVGGIRPNVTIGTVLNTQSGQLIGGVPFCFTYSY